MCVVYVCVPKYMSLCMYMCMCIICVLILFVALLLCVLMGQCVHAISKHHHHTHTHIITVPSSHIHLNTVTPDYTHTCTYRNTLHTTGANGGDVQRRDQKDSYIFLKSLKFLLKEWAKDLNAIEKRSYKVKKGAGCLCIVCACVYVLHVV